MKDDAADERRRVMDLLGGCWTTQVAGAAVALGVPDQMDEQALPSATIAARTGCAPDAMYRLLGALCAINLAEQTGADCFRLTAMGRLLRSDATGSLASLATAWAGRRWEAFGQLATAVRTGTPAAGGFNTASPDPAVGIAASRAQVDRSRLPAQAAATEFDWTRFARVLDVGGGHGTVLAAILRAHPGLSGAVFDLPHHEPQTLAFLAAEGVADRGGFIGGSFFDGLPTGFDAIVLKSILHDWADEGALAILRACAAALGSGGTLIVIEELLPAIATDDPATASAFRTDLTMLVSTGGRERTEAAYRDLIDAAGFGWRRTWSRSTEFRLLEAVVP